MKYSEYVPKPAMKVFEWVNDSVAQIIEMTYQELLEVRINPGMREKLKRILVDRISEGKYAHFWFGELERLENLIETTPPLETPYWNEIVGSMI